MENLTFRDGRCLNRESATFEAKSARNGMPRSLWESYSAFANTSGGTIVLGLDETDDGEGFIVSGVRNAEGIRDDMWSTLNNPEKISVNILTDGDMTVRDAGGKDIIVIDVPPADRTLRPVYVGNVNGGTYKRNGTGDYHCNAEDIAAMYRDASPQSRDSLPAGTAEMDDLDMGSVTRYKKAMASNSRTVGGWTDEDDTEFLRLIGAARRDGDVLRPTMAGLMMFGRGNIIQMVIPGFTLDYREYPDGGDEWTLRRLSGMPDWSGNLFDFYMFVINRLPQVVGTGFDVPDGLTRRDDTDLLRALRETVTNAVAHADYWGRGGVRIAVRPGSVSASNPGTFRIPVSEAVEGGHSDPRNETLLRMLNYIGRAERAGSGVRNVFRICMGLDLAPPSFEEGRHPDSVTVTIRFAGDRDRGVSDTLAVLIARDGRITISQMVEATGLTRNRILSELDVMKAEGRLKRVGGPRGRWELRW